MREKQEFENFRFYLLVNLKYYSLQLEGALYKSSNIYRIIKSRLKILRQNIARPTEL